MRKLDVELARGTVSEQAAFEARMYAKSGSYLADYNSPPTRTVPKSGMTSHRFAAFKRGCVQIAGPFGRLP